MMQSNPSNIFQSLLSTSFKSALIDLLTYEIRSQHYKAIVNEKTVFYTWKQSCIKIKVDNNEVISSGVDELSCSHNEADTRILSYARYAAENTSDPHIVVRASDTDIFILLFHFTPQLDAQIRMDTGSSSLNTRRNSDISSIAIVCAALPGFHAFTGSDYTASFMGKGKVRPFGVMIKNEEFLHTFNRQGQSDIVSSEVSAALECYVCALYGQSNTCSAIQKCMLHIRSSVLEKLNNGQTA